MAWEGLLAYVTTRSNLNIAEFTDDISVTAAASATQFRQRVIRRRYGITSREKKGSCAPQKR